MKTKLTVLTLLALLIVTLVAASPAMAEEQPERVLGEITALDEAAQTITIQPKEGDPVVIGVGETTKYFRKLRQGHPVRIEFADLAVGDEVVALGEWQEGSFFATKVMILPPPPPPPPVSIVGVITEIDEAALSFTLQTPKGDAVSVQTSETTRFYQKFHDAKPEAITFADLSVDDRLVAQGSLVEGVLNAVRVFKMPPPPVSVVGQITAIDEAAGSFDVQPENGKPVVTVQTGEGTHFYLKPTGSPRQEITFEDLAVNDHVALNGYLDGGVLNALNVVVLPPKPVKVIGDITALDETALTIEVQPKEGDRVTIQTMENTRFYRKPAGGTLVEITFADLAVGDRVNIKAVLEGETLMGKVVIVLPPPPPPAATKIVGIITAIDPVSMTLTVQPPNMDPVLAQLDGESDYWTKERSSKVPVEIAFEDLALNDRVTIIGAWLDDIFDTARVIVMPPTPGQPR